MSDARQERRKFTRVDFDTDIDLQQGDNHYATQLVDISLNGMLVRVPDNCDLASNTPMEIAMVLSEDVTVHMQVSLVHKTEALLGFQCLEIDLDSISHLRRLIELNIGEPNAVDRVLSELIELHH